MYSSICQEIWSSAVQFAKCIFSCPYVVKYFVSVIFSNEQLFCLKKKRASVVEFHSQSTSYHGKQKIILSLVNSWAVTNDPVCPRPCVQVYTQRAKPINAPINDFGENSEYFFPSLPLLPRKSSVRPDKRETTECAECQQGPGVWFPLVLLGSESGAYCPED